MNKVFNKCKLIISNMICAARSCTWKRDDRIVLFGAWFGDRFADNSRYLFQYLSQHKDALGLKNVVWVTANEKICSEINGMGYEAYMMDSEESRSFHKQAGIHIICNASSYKNGTRPDIRTEYSYGAKRINLWHGVGVVKGVGCDSLEYKREREKHKIRYAVKEALEKLTLYRRFVLCEGGWGDFYFLSPTQAATEQFRRFSYIPRKKFINTLYPRACPCPQLTDYEARIVHMIEKAEKTVLYVPTFRTGGNRFDYTQTAQRLQDVLGQQRILWIQKAHSAAVLSKDESSSENVLNLPSDFDINTVIPYVDLLITDYSSAASDARFFNKPVLFYVPDYTEYMNGDNGVTSEAEELLSGPKFYDLQSLSEGLVKHFEDPSSAYPANYSEVRDKYWGPAKELSEIWDDIRSVIGS